jgi:hypothetical protein
VDAGLVPDPNSYPTWQVEADTDTIVKGEDAMFWVWPDAEDWPSFAYEWDFDYDGQTFEPDPGAGDEWYATKTFDSVGTRTVAARVTGGAGNAKVVTSAVSVGYPPPLLTHPGGHDGRYWRPDRSPGHRHVGGRDRPGRVVVQLRRGGLRTRPDGHHPVTHVHV